MIVSNIRSYLRKHRQHLIAFCIFVVIVTAANGVYLLGVRSSNPLPQKSGLAVSSYGKVLLGEDTIDPNNGFTSQALGKVAADKIMNGKMPYWNEYEGVGVPLLAGMQSAALFPLTMLLKLDNGLLYSHIILELIAGFFTYLFLRRLKIRFSLSIAGGIIFALNGTFAWLTNAAFNPIAFLPMLMLGIEEAVACADHRSRGGYALIAIAIALSLYAGFPETAYINTIFASLWALLRALMLKTRTLKVSAIKKLVVGYVSGLLIAAPVVVAFGSYISLAYVGGHSGTFAYAHLSLLAIPAQVLPYAFGTIFGFSSYDASGTLAGYWGSVGGYFTISTCVFAIFGLFSHLNRGLKIFILMWLILCMMKMFGIEPGVFLWNLVPAIKSAAFYRYVIPSLSFALVIMAAYGAEMIANRKVLMSRYAAISLAVGMFLILLIVIAKHYLVLISLAPSHAIFFYQSIAWAMAIVSLIVASRLIVKRRFVPIVFTAIVTVDSLAMFIIPQLSTPIVTTDTSVVTFLQKNIGIYRFYSLGPLAPNYGGYYGISSINNNDLPVPKRWATYISANLDSNTDAITFTGSVRKRVAGPSAVAEFIKNIDSYRHVGVKYVVASHGQLSANDIHAASLVSVFESDTTDIYQLSDVRPYFTVDDGCTIQSQSRYTLHVYCSRADQVLTRGELWLPGWNVTVNGRSGQVNLAKDKLFQSVKLQKGSNVIVFVYKPPYIDVAWLLCLLGLGITLYGSKQVRRVIWVAWIYLKR